MGNENMEFSQRKSTLWIASGNLGVFVITKRNGRWWGQYNGKMKSFNFPPTKSLKAAKEMCKENAYWEEE